MTEDELSAQDDTTHTVGHRGGDIYIVLTYVLMPFGREDISLVLMYPHIEGDSMLDDREI